MILLSLWILVMPWRWLGALAVASGIHELAHILALRLMGVRICGIRFLTRGIYLKVGQMTPVQECVCAAAGPVGSFALLGLIRVFPEAAILGIGQGLFNLIPIYPFDGGRVLRVLMSERILMPKRLLPGGVVAGVLILIIATSLIFLFPSCYLFVLVGFCALLARSFRKTPCIDGILEVQ